MTPSPDTAGEARADTLRDGFFANQIRTNFRNLVRMVGFEAARASVAGIVNDEAERKAS